MKNKIRFYRKVRKFDMIFGTIWLILLKLIIFLIFFEAITHTIIFDSIEYALKNAAQLSLMFAGCFIFLFYFIRKKYIYYLKFFV